MVKKIIRKDKNASREPGNVIDQLASVIVMIMIFAMILAMVSYGKMVSKKLLFDNCVRNYLYIAEQEGYLSGYSTNKNSYSGRCSQLKNTLLNAGASDVVVESDTSHSQVAYGDPVIVHVTIKFRNPLYTNLSSNGRENVWFVISGLQKDMTYSVKLASTARW